MKNITNQNASKQDFLKLCANLAHPELLQKLNSSFSGLQDSHVQIRQKIYGQNTITTKSFIWYKKLLRCFINPFILVLASILVFHIISYFYLSDYDKSDIVSSVILVIMITLSTFITYFQDYRSYKSAAKLKSMVSTTTSVLRNCPDNISQLTPTMIAQLYNKTTEIAISNLVPGDIVILSAGDIVPADIRILQATDLFINQATLTGESELVEKSALIKVAEKNLLHCPNLAFMGTSINAGSCIAVVVSTARNTYLGTISTALTEKMPRNAFNVGIRRITMLLIGIILVMTPLVFLINFWTKHDAIGAVLFAISVAVGLTPEMLPMIVSANLARGAVKMSHQKVIVKNLTAIQSFGEMDILCTDKTGTLTNNEIELIEHLDADGIENQRVLELAFLNSYYQTGIKNNIDTTIIKHIKAHHNQIIDDDFYKIDEIPFDFKRRCLSVAISHFYQSTTTLVTKGAVEEILKICTKVEINGEVQPITPDIKRRVLNLSNRMNQDGIRVIAVCYQNFDKTKSQFQVDDEKAMIFVGYLGFLDVPKLSAAKAIKSLAKHGVATKILTGDNEIVTMAICKKLGIEPGTPLLGEQIATMSDEQLATVIKKTLIFAKIDPLQKARIIRVLKQVGCTVGFMGDGVNDAVALKAADVGICVDSGVEIAKEVADIILLEKDLNVLEQGVITGRYTFANIIKYIKITLSSNFGNVFSVLIASAWLPFVPMASLQLIFQNLLYDISQLAIPWDRVDAEYLEKPRKWEAKSFATFAIWNGPLSSIFDVTTFCFMGLFLGTIEIYNHNPDGGTHAMALFQSGWFVLGLISQTVIVHLCRTSKFPVLQSRSTWPLAVMTFSIVGIALILPFTQLGSWIGLVPLPAIYFGYLALAIFAYIGLNQLVKMLYKKLYHRWL